MYADSLGRLNTIGPTPRSFRSYSLEFTPEMRYMTGTAVVAMQVSHGILSHRHPLALTRVTDKSIIGFCQPFPKD